MALIYWRVSSCQCAGFPSCLRSEVVTHIVFVCGKPMIYPRGQNDQIILLQPNPDPVVILASDIEITGPVADVPNLLVLMEMLAEEHLDLVFVDGAHGGGRDGDFIAVLVVAVFGDGVDGRDRGAMVVENAERGEVAGGDFPARVVG